MLRRQALDDRVELGGVQTLAGGPLRPYLEDVRRSVPEWPTAESGPDDPGRHVQPRALWVHLPSVALELPRVGGLGGEYSPTRIATGVPQWSHGMRTRGVRIIPDRLRPARGSTASLPTPRGARLHWRETIPRPALLRYRSPMVRDVPQPPLPPCPAGTPGRTNLVEQNDRGVTLAKARASSSTSTPPPSPPQVREDHRRSPAPQYQSPAVGVGRLRHPLRLQPHRRGHRPAYTLGDLGATSGLQGGHHRGKAAALCCPGRRWHSTPPGTTWTCSGTRSSATAGQQAVRWRQPGPGASSGLVK